MRGAWFFLFLILGTVLLPGLLNAEGIQWHSYQEGLAKGKAGGKRIFVNFHADW